MLFVKLSKSATFQAVFGQVGWLLAASFDCLQIPAFQLVVDTHWQIAVTRRSNYLMSFPETFQVLATTTCRNGNGVEKHNKTQDFIPRLPLEGRQSPHQFHAPMRAKTWLLLEFAHVSFQSFHKVCLPQQATEKERLTPNWTLPFDVKYINHSQHPQNQRPDDHRFQRGAQVCSAGAFDHLGVPHHRFRRLRAETLWASWVVVAAYPTE